MLPNMAHDKSSKYLDVPSSEEDNQDYDSDEAQEIKGRSGLGRSNSRQSKRRKIHVEEPEENDSDKEDKKGEPHDAVPNSRPATTRQEQLEDEDEVREEPSLPQPQHSPSTSSLSKGPPSKPVSATTKKTPKPGVVYLSRLPPYLKPSTLRTLLVRRGFEPITRVFLTPAANAPSKRSNRRPTYTDGWIEFASRRTARLCAETLNATIVGGKKGGWYHDDVWNIKFLRGFGWEDLMEGVRREKKEGEARAGTERRRAGREARLFVEGVERGKMDEGIREKRKRKKDRDRGEVEVAEGGVEGVGDGIGKGEEKGAGEIRRTFRQNEAVGGEKRGRRDREKDDGLDGDVKRVLSKIF
jgi:ESF2/ABP1 family protein